MKRTQIPRRSTPLLRTATLTPGGPLARKRFERNAPRLALVSGGGAAPVVPIRRQQRKDTGPTQDDRKAVLVRDGYACVCCGRSIIGQLYSLGHRLRASQGGRAVPENLLTFLGWGGEACHGRIDNRRDEADERNGYTVRSWQDPALVPVTLFDGRKVWLTPGGRYADEPPQGAA